MFSLIITLISIALAILLAVAAIYYGGSVSSGSTARNAAAALINQGSQINAAGTMATTQGAGWPASTPAFGPPFLSVMPVPPLAAYADSSAVATASDWTYYISPTAEMPIHHFVLKAKISEKVCMAINKEQGLIGIPAVWDGKSMIQCFGPGVPTRPEGPLGYTFFYDPIGGNPTQTAASLEQSKSEAGSAIPGYPRLCPDGTVVPAGLCVIPGSPLPSAPPPVTVAPTSDYPKTCLDGTIINAGICPVTTGGSAGYVSKINIFPSVLRTDGTTFSGSGFVYYCVTFPLPTPDWSTVVTVDGVQLVVEDAFVAGDQQCVAVSSHPLRAVGTYRVLLAVAEGTSGNAGSVEGSIAYASSVGAAPVLQSLLPNKGSATEVTRVTVHGAGFVRTSAVVIGSVKMATTFVDSTTLQVDIPPGNSYGYEGEDLFVPVVIQNPDGSTSTQSITFYYASGVGGDIGGGGYGGGGDVTPPPPPPAD